MHARIGNLFIARFFVTLKTTDREISEAKMRIGNQVVVRKFFYELVKQADGVDVIFASLKRDGQSESRVFGIIFGRMMANFSPVCP